MLKFAEDGQEAQISLVPEMMKKKQKIQYCLKLRPHKTKFI
jgi:hypothetical protein